MAVHHSCRHEHLLGFAEVSSSLLHCLLSLQSKLQKAANMVWELLQPANARFLPMDVVPGGSMRLIVAQAKAAASKASVQQAAAKVRLCAQASVPGLDRVSRQSSKLASS